MARVRVVCQRCNTGLEREVPARAPRTTPGIVPPLLTRCPKCREVVLVDDPNIGHVVNGKWKLVERLGCAYGSAVASRVLPAGALPA